MHNKILNVIIRKMKMKKIIICILSIFLIIICIVVYGVYQKNENTAQIGVDNKTYESYENKEVLGTDIISIIKYNYIKKNILFHIFTKKHDLWMFFKKSTRLI